ncbi:hypothetical protein ABZ869_26510 [Streptomyces sp. NPDC046928]|uniref:hypothetical protein n=1 Tax=Streptomyces sp. NPDC046928 TaxID=3155021 RepID=UPI0033CB49A0
MPARGLLTLPIQSPYGHDGFLIETDQVTGLVRALLPDAPALPHTATLPAPSPLPQEHA